jgi:starch-binding outer membrane protein, SusD/RagB family
MIRAHAFKYALLLALVAGVSACDMDLVDPNNPEETQATGTVAGLKQIGVGLQATYANELVDPVYISALVTDQIGAIQAAFESFRNVDAGLPVNNSEGPSTEPWTGQYNVVQVADILIENVPNVEMAAGTESGLLALAKLFKAMSFGNLLQVYERIPLDVGPDNPEPQFATRQEGLTAVLTLLNEARQHITATPVSTEFTTEVLAPGFNLANTIDAMIARYSLIAGDNAGAAAAAQLVNLSILSEFRFVATDPNPLWNLWYNSGNAWRMRPQDQVRTNAQSGDQRVGYFVQASTTEVASDANSPLDNFVRYSSNTHSYPAYYPDEMRLIIAEVRARSNNLQGALDMLNVVRTQCTSTLDEPVACLPALTLANTPTQAAVLDAILRERYYELFLQGLYWSDLRRFGKPVKYTFMMVHRGECQNNQNAPAEVCELQTID